MNMSFISMNQNFSTSNYFSNTSTQSFTSSRSISQSSPSTNPATPTSIAPSPTKADDADRFKTEICRSWSEFGNCKYAARCKFAHGTAELREVVRHPRYKTTKCKHFHSMEVGATCSYGSRCHFIHGEKDKHVAENNNGFNTNSNYTKGFLLSDLNSHKNGYYSSSLNTEYSTSSIGSGGYLKEENQVMEIGHWGDEETTSNNNMNNNYIYSQVQLQLLKQLLQIPQQKCQLF